MSEPEKRGFFARFRRRPEPPVGTGEQAGTEATEITPEGEPRESWYQRLRTGLSRSSNRLKDNIGAILIRRKLDAASLEELEEALITADLGVETAGELIAELARTRFGKEVSEQEVRGALAQSMARILEPVARPLELEPAARPHVILVCGVNGTGKTTTIGKLAAHLKAAGAKVLLAAGDTFRAAAIEQLEIWGQRTGCQVVSRPPGADAAGLAYDALERARAEATDVLLIDTAGRLHNKQALMDELAKVVRVLKKLDPAAPHEILLVLDATTGQNARNQVETFRAMVPVTGLVVTKLDGTARGGVVVALARQFGLPVRALGIGERVEDLRPFEARPFADALLGIETG
jgi:fused signal recognition particle receptor